MHTQRKNRVGGRKKGEAEMLKKQIRLFLTRAGTLVDRVPPELTEVMQALRKERRLTREKLDRVAI